MGTQNPSEDTLLGYAMDNFPIHGPVLGSADVLLDECNGPTVNGKCQYHVRVLFLNIQQQI